MTIHQVKGKHVMVNVQNEDKKALTEVTLLFSMTIIYAPEQNSNLAVLQVKHLQSKHYFTAIHHITYITSKGFQKINLIYDNSVL